MRKIKQLPLHEAQKIAAGEVVERPANVVKELIENAIDAEATAISIYIERGGHQTIRIIDNGCGMEPDDAEFSFAHHATSKITHVEDLNSIVSFGFRGEALASISAVAKVTLTTKPKDNTEGIKLYRVDGKTKTIDEVSCPDGTDILIEEIFYNVPARKKFLKTAQTEWRQIALLFQAFCFDYPNIHFKLYHDGSCIHNCPPVASQIDRATQVWDGGATHSLITFEKQENSTATVSGFISNHQFYRYDRNHIFFFVNNRWVRNHHISRAFLNGYMNVIPAGKYPAGVINISIDPKDVDINIHPRKQEIQFLHPRKVETLITQGVKKSLEQNLSNQLKKPVEIKNTEPTNQFEAAEALRPKQFMESVPSEQKIPAFVPTDNFEAHAIDDIVYAQPEKQFTQTQPPESNVQKVIEEKEQELYRIIGNFSKTYILLEQDDGIFFVDQHAAHERVLYEQFKARFGNVETVGLLFPQIIQLSEKDFEIIQPHLDLLKQHGIAAEEFGNAQLTITATPVHMKNVAINEIIKEIAGIIQEQNHLEKDRFFKMCNEKIHAQMACKAAVKAGDSLTESQMQQLITDLYKTENRFACPHGRPTGWLQTTHEIEKKFKRKL